MTVADYIRGTFNDFGISISDANVIKILQSTEISPSDEQEALTEFQVCQEDIGILKFLPWLMARATSKSVNENGHSKSQSWDIKGIKELSAVLSKGYGLEDELNSDKPKVKFL